MSRSQYLSYFWGRSSTETPTVSLHYPLLAVLAIAASIAPTTWLLSSYQGYLISGATVVVLPALIADDLLVRSEAFIEDGYIEVLETPRLGVELDKDVAEQYVTGEGSMF